MSKAVICPICGGSGNLGDDFLTSDSTPKKCHGCDGKGWVEIGSGEITQNPVFPMYPSCPYCPHAQYPTITYITYG